MLHYFINGILVSNAQNFTWRDFALILIVFFYIFVTVLFVAFKHQLYAAEPIKYMYACMVSVLIPGASGPGLSPGPGTRCCVVGQDT